MLRIDCSGGMYSTDISSSSIYFSALWRGGGGGGEANTLHTAQGTERGMLHETFVKPTIGISEEVMEPSKSISSLSLVTR